MLTTKKVRSVIEASGIRIFLAIGIIGVAILIGMSFIGVTNEVEAAQGRPQPVQDGYQTTLQRPNSNSSVDVFCYKGELILRTETASTAGRGVSVSAIKDSDACK